MAITVEIINDAKPEVMTAINSLLPQLSSSATKLSDEEIESFLKQDCAHLLAARNDNGEVVGMLTLVVFTIPTGTRAWIEDVVVDESARGQGVGDALSRRAVDEAHRLGAKTVDLTSRPTREAANRLYQRIGFVPRETNIYRYSQE